MNKYTFEWTEWIKKGDLPQVPDNTTVTLTGETDGDDDYELVHTFESDNPKEYARKFADDWNIPVFSVFESGEDNGVYFTEEDL